MTDLTEHNYENFQEFTGKIAGQTISFISKPALPDWRHISPAASLLAEAIHPRWEDYILNIGCSHGVLASVLGKQVVEDHLVLLDSDQVALECAERTLHVNGIQHFKIPSGVSLLPQSAQSYDIIALDIPKGRKITHRWLLESYYLLKPGGSLYLAGANELGIQTVIKDAQELFGNAVIIAYKKGNRCAVVRKESERSALPEWAQAPGVTLGTWITFEVTLRDFHFKIQSMPGIFSFDHLDEGTALLLETISVPKHSDILDVGCGFGIIGIFAASKSHSSQITMLDSNRLAVAASQTNLIQNRIQNAEIFTSDLLDIIPGKRFHLILSNPPFHTGKEVNYIVAMSLVRQSFRALLPGGQLILVANRFIRYDYWIKEVFGNVDVLAQTNRFHILSATK